MGVSTHPPGSLRRRGRRLPAGRPELGVLAPAFKLARQLTACDRHREEARVVARLDAKQDRALAPRPGIREGLAHLLRGGDALACDIENDVAVLEALLRRRAIGLDLRHDHAFGAGARDLAGGSE